MLQRLRERLEPLLESVAAEQHALALSEMRTAAVGAAYSRAADLLSRDRISELQRVLAGSRGEEEARVRALLDYLVHARSSCAAAAELDHLLTWRAKGSLTVGEERVAVRGAPAAVAAIADPQERAALHEAWLAAVDEQAPLFEGYLARRREAVVELGYGDYAESCGILSEIDLRGLARDGDRFLSETEAQYRELLDWHLERGAGVKPGGATEADLLRLERGPGFDPAFAASQVWGLQTLLGETGIDVLAGDRIRLRSHRELPDGSPAVCQPLRVPDEIACDVAPAPGPAAHAGFLRSLGRALHHAYTDPSLDLEARWLGDASLPLAVGETFGALLTNRLLLSRFYRLNRTEMEGVLRLMELLRLLRIRRDVGQLRFELALFERPDSREARESYAAFMEGATGVRHDARGALWATEPAFRVARRLRAEQLQVIIGRHLLERLDEDWFRNPRAGEVLLALFRPGQSFSASEVAVQLGSQLSFDRVRESLEGH